MASCAAVAGVLFAWVREHADFVVGANEAGMILRGDTRGADGAVWRTSDAGPRTGRYRRAPPILAIEVAGEEQDEGALRGKARWYLDAGVERVWLVLPESREVVVVASAGEQRFGSGARIVASASLPGLEPEVADFFLQLDR